MFEPLTLAARDREGISELAYRLYAEGKRALLIVLQGMDTAGKDGVIRKTLQALDPRFPAPEPDIEKLRVV